MKYLLLFHGGKITNDKLEKSIKDRLQWMDKLRGQEKFVDGSPLQPTGTFVSIRGKEDYTHGRQSINGYVIIDVDDMNEAISISQTAPQLLEEYGAATAEIRPLKQLVD